MRRSLIHYWPMNLAVVAGAAVATAILTGALVVGDSLRDSLRRLTLERLGEVELAVVNKRFFGEQVVGALAQAGEFTERFGMAAPVITLRGSAVHSDSARRASRVGVYGIDSSFAAFFPDDPATAKLDLDPAAGQLFPSVVINDSLAQDLGARVGDSIILAFERQSAIPRESLLGSREAEEAVARSRLTVAAVLPDSGVGRFELSPRQALPLVAFVKLSDLQRVLGRPGEVNALLVGGAQTQDLEILQRLRESLSPQDLGLSLRRGDGWLAVESRRFVLGPEVVGAIDDLARETGATIQPLLTYLANRMEVGDRLLPYSTVTALEIPPPPVSGFLVTSESLEVPAIADDEILLNRWAAEDLDASPSDELELTYFVIGVKDELRRESARFRVAGVVKLAGLGADPSLTPDFPGISDAADMSAWDPPFPVDLDLIRPRDEEYWDRHRVTPKAFVTLTTGRKLWSGRFGDTTAIRLTPPEGSTTADLEDALQSGFMERLSLEAAGFRLLPVREQGLRASSGATDFSGLFFGFSLFLIVSAALLVGLLFSLLVGLRAREVGLRLAVGTPLVGVRRRLLAEGGIVALLGALVGTGLAVLYAGTLLRFLRSWWAPVIDSPFLVMSVRPLSLGLGLVLAVGLVLVSIWLAIRRLSKAPVTSLLAGSVASDREPRSGRLASWIAWASSFVAAVLLVAAIVFGAESSPALFFMLAAFLCLAGVAFFAVWCRRPKAGLENLDRADLARVAFRNSARNPGRSLLCVALVGAACFILVSVTANRKDFEKSVREQDSGTGGFALVAEAEVPLRQHPSHFQDLTQLDPEGVYPFRLLPGEDASCLNLYQPEKPRILGATPEFVDRGGFRFRQTLRDTDNPWQLLEEPIEPGVIPAIGDYNSVRWILHLGLGKDLELENDRGESVKLRVVGLLETSILQSEMVISQQNFLEHFPSHGGFGYFLVDSPPDETAALSQRLEEALAPYGLDATSTVDKLAAYQRVENMYLATFQALGGLGLLLGTVGLGIVLIRNTIERRGELATLQAFGYSRSALTGMVFAENAFLLGVGIDIGAVAGIVAVAPYLITGTVSVPWLELLATLAAVLGIGLLFSLGAAIGALRAPLLPALKTE